jgi:hypothetical protein
MSVRQRRPSRRREYARHGLPWLDLHDEDRSTLAGTTALRKVKSVRELDEDKSALPLQDDAGVEVGPVKKLWLDLAGAVRDGKW